MPARSERLPACRRFIAPTRYGAFVATDPRDLDPRILEAFLANFSAGVRPANERAAAEHLARRFTDGPELSQSLWGAGKDGRESIIDYLRGEYRRGAGIGETPGFPKNRILSNLRAWYEQGPSQGQRGDPTYVARRLAVTESAFYMQALDDAVDSSLEAEGMIDGYEILLAPEREDWPCDCPSHAAGGPYPTIQETPAPPFHPLCQCRRRPIFLKDKERRRSKRQQLADTGVAAAGVVAQYAADRAMQEVRRIAVDFVRLLAFNMTDKTFRALLGQFVRHKLYEARRTTRLLFMPHTRVNPAMRRPTTAETASARRLRKRQLEASKDNPELPAPSPAPKTPKAPTPDEAFEFDRKVRDLLKTAIKGAKKHDGGPAVFKVEAGGLTAKEILSGYFEGDIFTRGVHIGPAELSVWKKGGVIVEAGEEGLTHRPHPARTRPEEWAAVGDTEARDLTVRVWPATAVQASSLGGSDDEIVLPPGTVLRPFALTQESGAFIIDFREMPSWAHPIEYDDDEIDRFTPSSLSDPERERVRRDWRRIFPEPPQQVVEHMLFGLDVNLQAIGVDADVNGVRLSVETDAFTMTRRFVWTPGGITARHESLLVNRDRRGEGLGTGLLANSMYVYEALGFARVQAVATSRGENVGGYVWPRFGFTPTMSVWRQVRDRNVRPWITENRDRLTRAEVQELEELLAIENPRAIWSVAAHPLGREALTGGEEISWVGAIDLSDSAAMQRFNSYTKRLPIVINRETQDLAELISGHRFSAPDEAPDPEEQRHARLYDAILRVSTAEVGSMYQRGELVDAWDRVYGGMAPRDVQRQIEQAMGGSLYDGSMVLLSFTRGPRDIHDLSYSLHWTVFPGRGTDAQPFALGLTITSSGRVTPFIWPLSPREDFYLTKAGDPESHFLDMLNIVETMQMQWTMNLQDANPIFSRMEDVVLHATTAQMLQAGLTSGLALGFDERTGAPAGSTLNRIVVAMRQARDRMSTDDYRAQVPGVMRHLLDDPDFTARRPGDLSQFTAAILASGSQRALSWAREINSMLSGGRGITLVLPGRTDADRSRRRLYEARQGADARTLRGLIVEARRLVGAPEPTASGLPSGPAEQLPIPWPDVPMPVQSGGIPTPEVLASQKATWGQVRTTKAEVKEVFEEDWSDEQVDYWNEKVGVTPTQIAERFYTLLPPEIVGTYKWQVSPEPRIGSILFSLSTRNSPTGVYISGMNRTISISRGHVSHNSFVVEYGGNRAKYAGIGKAAFQVLVDLYDHLGITEISVSAGMTTGGYAWAKYGFVPDESDAERLAQTFMQDVLGVKPYDEYRRQELQNDDATRLQLLQEARARVAVDAGLIDSVEDYEDLDLQASNSIDRELDEGEVQSAWDDLVEEFLQSTEDDEALYWADRAADHDLDDYGEPYVIWNIADHPEGSDFLRGRSWSGTLDLDDDRQRERLMKYIQPPDIPRRFYEEAAQELGLTTFTRRPQSTAPSMPTAEEAEVPEWVPTPRLGPMRVPGMMPDPPDDIVERGLTAVYEYFIEHELRVIWSNPAVPHPTAERLRTTAAGRARAMLATLQVHPADLVRWLEHVPEQPVYFNLLSMPVMRGGAEVTGASAEFGVSIEASAKNPAYDPELARQTRSPDNLPQISTAYSLSAKAQVTRDFIDVHVALMSDDISLTPSEAIAGLGHLYQVAHHHNPRVLLDLDMRAFYRRVRLLGPNDPVRKSYAQTLGSLVQWARINDSRLLRDQIPNYREELGRRLMRNIAPTRARWLAEEIRDAGGSADPDNLIGLAERIATPTHQGSANQDVEYADILTRLVRAGEFQYIGELALEHDERFQIPLRPGAAENVLPFDPKKTPPTRIGDPERRFPDEARTPRDRWHSIVPARQVSEREYRRTPEVIIHSGGYSEHSDPTLWRAYTDPNRPLEPWERGEAAIWRNLFNEDYSEHQGARTAQMLTELLNSDQQVGLTDAQRWETGIVHVDRAANRVLRTHILLSPPSEDIGRLTWARLTIERELVSPDVNEVKPGGDIWLLGGTLSVENTSEQTGIAPSLNTLATLVRNIGQVIPGDPVLHVETDNPYLGLAFVNAWAQLDRTHYGRVLDAMEDELDRTLGLGGEIPNQGRYLTVKKDLDLGRQWLRDYDEGVVGEQPRIDIGTDNRALFLRALGQMKRTLTYDIQLGALQRMTMVTMSHNPLDAIRETLVEDPLNLPLARNYPVRGTDEFRRTIEGNRYLANSLARNDEIEIDGAEWQAMDPRDIRDPLRATGLRDLDPFPSDPDVGLLRPIEDVGFRGIEALIQAGERFTGAPIMALLEHPRVSQPQFSELLARDFIETVQRDWPAGADITPDVADAAVDYLSDPRRGFDRITGYFMYAPPTVTQPYAPIGAFVNIDRIRRQSPRAAVAPRTETYNELIEPVGQRGADTYTPVGRWSVDDSLLGVAIHELAHTITSSVVTTTIGQNARDRSQFTQFEEGFYTRWAAYQARLEAAGSPRDLDPEVARELYPSDYSFFSYGHDAIMTLRPRDLEGLAAEILSESAVGMALDSARFRREYPELAELVTYVFEESWREAGMTEAFDWPAPGELHRQNVGVLWPTRSREPYQGAPVLRGSALAPASVDLPVLERAGAEVLWIWGPPTLTLRAQALSDAPAASQAHQTIHLVMPDRRPNPDTFVEDVGTLLRQDGAVILTTPVSYPTSDPGRQTFTEIGGHVDAWEELRKWRNVLGHAEVLDLENDIMTLVASPMQERVRSALDRYPQFLHSASVARASGNLPLGGHRFERFVDNPVYYDIVEGPHPDDVDPEDEYRGYVWTDPEGRKLPVLYHGTRLDHAVGIREVGLVPDVGEWVAEVYGDVPEGALADASFLASGDEQTKSIQAMLQHIAYKIGAPSRLGITAELIYQHGAIVAFTHYDPEAVFRMHEDQTYVNALGEEGEPGDFPYQAEPYDWWTRDPMQGSYIIYGRELLRYLLAAPDDAWEFRKALRDDLREDIAMLLDQLDGVGPPPLRREADVATQREVIELEMALQPGAAFEEERRAKIQALLNTVESRGGRLARPQAETVFGPVAFASDASPRARSIPLTELLELDRRLTPWIDPALRRGYSLALLAAVRGYDVIDAGPVRAIITSEAVPAESAALISGETKALERIRTENPEVDFEYLIYRKARE